MQSIDEIVQKHIIIEMVFRIIGGSFGVVGIACVVSKRFRSFLLRLFFDFSKETVQFRPWASKTVIGFNVLMFMWLIYQAVRP